jgi:pimeloyl-[acyl-carrier protein] methyl ester esterase
VTSAAAPAGAPQRMVLLPGMDGTGALFDRFRAAAPPGFVLDVVPLPAEPLTYEEIEAAVAPVAALTPRTVLLGESFSGPLALRLAAHTPVAAVVLVNSFVRSPVPARLARMATPMFFRLPVPEVLLRRTLLGADADAALVRELRAALERVPAKVLASRVKEIGRVDASAELARVERPLLYLRGTDDRVVGEASVEAIRARAPRVVVTRVAGPHLLLQASPVAAWEAIVPFLGARAVANV